MKNISHYPTLEYQGLLKIIFGLKTEQSEDGLHKLIMVGGVHGCGKTSLCERLSKDIPDLTWITASQIIDHSGTIKNVDNVKYNQIILSEYIKEIKNLNKMTIVDGHFCVPDRNGYMQYVGKEIFQTLAPDILVLVQAPPSIIKQRIFLRDNIIYSFEFIEKLIRKEAHWADYTSKSLSIPVCKVNG